jgi:hypothetical protein
MLRFVSSVRDAVYGAVPLTQCEVELLSTRCLTRMRGIKQTGFAHLEFPGANHTRFEHCIGTMHTAWMMSQGIPDISEDLVAMARLAGLLHDIGHGPFSHALEFASRAFSDELPPEVAETLCGHETHTKQLVLNDPQVSEIITSHASSRAFSLEDVAALAVGEYEKPATNSVLSGPVDADKIDYILRDNHHCGFNVGLDIHSLGSIFQWSGEGAAVLNDLGRSFAEQLIVGRYHLVTRVHHALRNRMANFILALCLREAILHGGEDACRRLGDVCRSQGDAQLLSFVEQHSPTHWPFLQEYLEGGDGRFTEIKSFGFAVLGPKDRYDAWIAATNPQLIGRLSRALQQRTKRQDVYVDVYTASVPDGELGCLAPDDPAYVMPLRQQSLVSGVLSASHACLSVAIYGASPCHFALSEADLKEYARFDATMDMEKAQSMVDTLWKGDPSDLACQMILTSILAEASNGLRGKQRILPDFVPLVLYAVDAAVVEALDQRRVAIDGIANLEEFMAGHLWKCLQKVGYPEDLKRHDRDEHTGFLIGDPCSRLCDEIGLLADLSLIYAEGKTIKIGRTFQPRLKLSMAGWGRGYVETVLSDRPELSDFVEAVKAATVDLIGGKAEQYGKYFDLVGQRKRGPERKEYARNIPLELTK